MNYLDILLPIGLILFGGLVAYLIGFLIGRWSAYQDIQHNLNKGKEIKLVKKPAGAQGVFHSQLIK